MGYWMHVYSRSDEVKTAAAIREDFALDDVVIHAHGDEGESGWVQVRPRRKVKGEAAA